MKNKHISKDFIFVSCKSQINDAPVDLCIAKSDILRIWDSEPLREIHLKSKLDAINKVIYCYTDYKKIIEQL